MTMGRIIQGVWCGMPEFCCFETNIFAVLRKFYACNHQDACASQMLQKRVHHSPNALCTTSAVEARIQLRTYQDERLVTMELRLRISIHQAWDRLPLSWWGDKVVLLLERITASSRARNA
jgi:hypothetical protein